MPGFSATVFPFLQSALGNSQLLVRLRFAKGHVSGANRKVVHLSSSSKERMNAVYDERFCDAFENSWPNAEKCYT
jgi:hypothetical protein